MDNRPLLRAAFGPYPALDRLRAAEFDRFRLHFAEVRPITRAFAPMLRDAAFDVCEMALATALQAQGHGVPVVLLPVVLTARYQEASLRCRADSTLAGPAALAGCRVGVRAYSQTTGVWLRGILAEMHGVAAQDVRWTTFEPAHVAQYADPPWAGRAPPGSDMLAMLHRGELDAAVFGTEVPDDPGLRTVFPDPAAAARAFRATYGFTPVNHVAVVTAGLAAAHPDWVAELTALLPPGGPDLDLAMPVMRRFLREQSMLPLLGADQG